MYYNKEYVGKQDRHADFFMEKNRSASYKLVAIVNFYFW